MKKLLVLLFILYHFPAKAVTIDAIVCLDHVKHTATVYYNVQAPDDYKYLTFDEIRSIVCKRLKHLKRGN